MSRLEVPRPDLEAALLARTRAGGPFLLTGPPGAGKTTLLLKLRERLVADGWQPVYLDLMGGASSPDRFVRAALDVLPAEPFAARLTDAMRLRQLAAEGRIRSADAVRALLALWSSLDQAAGRPVALLLDEATEIRSLAYFAGLRQAAEAMGAALRARPRGTVLATSFPTLARRLWPGLDTLDVRALVPADLGESGPAAAVRGGFGWPRYVRVLLERAQAGDDLAEAWADEMAAGGRLEAACRHTYESLLLRSRGYGIAKATLQAVAHEEGLNLTALVGRLGRTPGATRDYLQWLVGVDALRVARKRYYYVDGLLRWWVRLHARGWPPTPAELQAAGLSAIAEATAPSAPSAGTEKALAEPPASARRDSLIEID
jgi:hypothetical protein